jgi:hypothetical protein
VTKLFGMAAKAIRSFGGRSGTCRSRHRHCSGAAGWSVRDDHHASWVRPSEGGCARHRADRNADQTAHPRPFGARRLPPARNLGLLELVAPQPQLVMVRVEEVRVTLRDAGPATSIRRSSSMNWPSLPLPQRRSPPRTRPTNPHRANPSNAVSAQQTGHATYHPSHVVSWKLYQARGWKSRPGRHRSAG